MMRAEPFTLARVASEHPQLQRMHVARDRHVSGWLRPLSERIEPLDGVAIIEVRNHMSRCERPLRCIRRGGDEAGPPCEQASLLVVEHVVVRRVCKHQRWCNLSKQV